MPHFADVCVVTRTFFTSNLGKDGGSRLTPVVENRDRFKLFGVGVFAISPPERRGAAAAAAAGEGVPPSSRSRAPPGSSRAPPGCWETYSQFKVLFYVRAKTKKYFQYENENLFLALETTRIVMNSPSSHF